MNNEPEKSLTSMEEIPLEDADGTSMEYRLLRAYTQQRLSLSKYGQRLEREAKAEEESREIVQASGLAKEEEVTLPEISPAEICFHKPPSQDVDQKKVKKKAKKVKARSTWKCLWMPSCLRPQGKDDPWIRNMTPDLKAAMLSMPPDQGTATLSMPPDREAVMLSTSPRKETVIHHPMQPEGAGSLPDGQNDSEISHLVERLAEIVDHSKFPSERKSFQGVDRTLSLEEDGGWASKPGPQEGGEGTDMEEKIIDAIVALLRKSGDELQETMQKNKTFWQRIRDTITSYAFFRRVIDQYFEQTPIDSTENSEDQVKSIKVALMMEATARLTAVDSHPMNLMLGFGTKYLQENFSPWIQSRGGWGKALGLPDQED